MSDVVGTLGVRCRGEELILCSERALYWPREATLVVADVHLGKESAFGRAGLAIPDGATESDLERLSALCRLFDARRLLVLGDLVHAAPAPDADWPGRVSRWLDRLGSVEVAVAAGNHDRPAARRRLDERIVWHLEDVEEPPFRFAHEPEACDGLYTLSGHLHPVYRLDSGADRLRCPVFWFRDGYAVLPAFGEFTGGARIDPRPGERVFLAGQGGVLELPRRSRSGRHRVTGAARSR